MIVDNERKLEANLKKCIKRIVFQKEISVMERGAVRSEQRPPSPASLVKSLEGLHIPVNVGLAALSTPNFVLESSKGRKPTGLQSKRMNSAATHSQVGKSLMPPALRKTTLGRKTRKEKKRFSLIEKRFGTHANKFRPTRTQKQLLNDLKPKWQRSSLPLKEAKTKRRKKRRDKSLENRL